MPVPSYAQHIQISFLDSMNRVRAAAGPQQPAENSPEFDISFDDILDVVNPLQHFPVVSTLYRKYTGDQIKPLEKIAGDTLYGGPMGFASSLADLAFEKITGKNFGDTVLAFVMGENSNRPSPAVASSGRTPSAEPAVEALAGVPPAVTSGSPAPLPVSSVLGSAATGAPPPGPSIPAADPNQASVDALTASLDGKNFESTLRTRMLDAYRWTAGLQTQLPSAAQ